jgi:hypothetical protein
MRDWRRRFPPGELLWEGAIGSGYPGDAITKEWLSNNVDKFWGPPSTTRFRCARIPYCGPRDFLGLLAVG